MWAFFINLNVVPIYNLYSVSEVVISLDSTEIRSDIVYKDCKVMTLADLAANLNHL